MFFDPHQVNNLLNCKMCDGRLNDPKLLPCGSNICSYCAASIKLNGKQYDCLVCSGQHKMPKKGLPQNNLAAEMLSFKPIKVSRGKLFDSLQKSLNDIQKKHAFIKLGIEHSTDRVKENCMELRSDVQLKAEEVILQVNDISTKLIEKIDEYEKDIVKFNKLNSNSFDVFNAIVKELESFHAINTEYLKQNELNDTLLVKLNEDAINLINKVEMEIENLNDLIFNGTKLKFNRKTQKISESILGELMIAKLNSSILPEFEKIKDLMILCEFPVDQKWNLIYRASQDGFEASNFHSKCDNKQNTLVVIKSENGNVFGGYTEQSWMCEEHEEDEDYVFKDDPKSYIFSLINSENKPLKINFSYNDAIGCKKTWGPTFGGSEFDDSDIYITNQPNINDCHSNLGCSYNHPDYAEGSNVARKFLAGQYHFKVSEIEVYTKD